MSSRLPAEWEQQGAVLLSWPHKETDWAYMLDEVTNCYIEIAKAITSQARLIVVSPECDYVKELLSRHISLDDVMFVPCDTNDTWARDFGAITTINNDGEWEINDFQFNGWGLKFAANYDNLITRAMVDAKVLNGKYKNHLGFTLEGGSIESDGKGLLLTTSECLLSPNRNGDLSRAQIEQYLCNSFGVSKVLWLDYGALMGDDTDSHIDTLARLCPHDTIMYVGCNDENDPHFEELLKMKAQLMTFSTLSGNPFNLVELPLPDPIYDEDGLRLPATYANFLILNNAVLMPIYGQPQNDKLAEQLMKIAFPEYEIITIDCNALIKQHGSLHCVTMQFPQNILPK
jgi:agmatine/peptidylarginine deiminase